MNRNTVFACVSVLICSLLAVGCGGNKSNPEDTSTDDAMIEDVTDVSLDDEATEDVPEEECISTGEEVCDSEDNDCDGEVDEDFDLINDERNCGTCNFICNIANGESACVDGLCRIESCDEGFIDLNAAAVDGCEYDCTATLDAESIEDDTCTDTLDNDCDGRVDGEDTDCSDCVPEFCDEMDNDCDGLVDEDFDLQEDPLNCGSCGSDCPVRPHSTPSCVRGECSITCEAEWQNVDLDDANGCELRCMPHPTLDETACDGIDADCDGLVDEDYIPDSCGVGECEVDAVCWRGVEDCIPLVPLYEMDAVCDGLDEDCDGTADDDYSPSAFCEGICRDSALCVDGTEICGDPDATTDEVCDGNDEDCDGDIDEDYEPWECGDGSCIRLSTCVGGIEDCIMGAATTEVCNGSDDDCDGSIDNGVAASMCPPPAQVETTECVVCGPGCGECAIAPGGCLVGWYDVNVTYIDGCECQPEDTESASTSCSNIHDLGDLDDDGTTRLIRGNIVPFGDNDWYMFRAVDLNDTSCDQYHVRIEFTSNPGDAFRFDVYRGPETEDCAGVAECTAESRTYDRDMNFRSGTGSLASGECPCTNPETDSLNICDNDTEYYFIRVYAIGPVTCDSYTIRVSNNPA